MSGSLAQVLLRIAAAAAPDGGAGVRAALQAALRDEAAFDVGEIILKRPHREPLVFPLGGASGPLVGPELVDHVLAHGAPYRIDDLPDALAFPVTEARMREHGVRSALVLPFRFDEHGMVEVTGALAVCRTHGWAFVGASLPMVAPLAGMAGLALDHALRLSALGERAHALEVASPWAAPAAEGQQARERTSSAAGEEPVEGEPVREALREAREAGRQLRSRLDAAEERLLEAERLRDEWAQRATTLGTRLEEQGAAMQALKREVVGARETAASAAEVAEAHGARVRELEAQLRQVRGGS